MTPRRPKVLIVDDDPALLETAAQLVERAGFEAATCAARVNRLNLIREARPDLVLMDVNMPFLSGVDVMRLMREVEELRQTRVVLFSSNDEWSLRRMARESGAWGWIPKASMGLDFGRRISQALEGL
jgi:DNA-binding response OmpR family regulator